MFCGWVGGEHVNTTELYTLKGLEIKIFLLKNIIGSFSSPECLDQNFQSVECFCFLLPTDGGLVPDTMLESGIPILTTWQAILKGLIAQIRQQHRLHTHLARLVKAKDSRESGDLTPGSEGRIPKAALRSVSSSGPHLLLFPHYNSLQSSTIGEA